MQDAEDGTKKGRRRDAVDPELTFLPIRTHAGLFAAGYSAHGLARIHFPSPPQGGSSGAPLLRNPSALAPRSPLRGWHRLTTRAVQAVLRGVPPPALPPLDLTCGTPFQRAVWAALRRIGPGRTMSYGTLARRIGRPAAARAAGRACGANPVPLLVPCHRILAAGGALGGFSGGLEWKTRLLHVEGARTRSTHRSSAAAARNRAG